MNTCPRCDRHYIKVKATKEGRVIVECQACGLTWDKKEDNDNAPSNS